MNSLFAYGTLLEPRIWKAVTGADTIESVPATLAGHAIYRVEGYDFPGIVTADPEDRVPGRLFTGIDTRMLARLDAYEDEFYERRDVTVFLDGAEPVSTQTYLIPDRNRSWLSNAPWTIEWFRTEAMAAYLKRHGFTD